MDLNAYNNNFFASLLRYGLMQSDVEDAYCLGTRSAFRPKPSNIVLPLLQSAMGKWFVQDADAPFIMQAHQIREDKRELIHAVSTVTALAA